MKKKVSPPILFFFLFASLLYYFSIKDSKKICYGTQLKVLTINSFNLTPDIPEINYIGSSFADMTMTRLSQIKSINLIERVHLERAKKKLGIKPGDLITKELAVKIGDLLDADLVVIGTIQTLTKDSFKVGSQILDLRKEDKKEEIFTSEPVNIKDGIEGIEKSENIESINRLQGEVAQFITKSIPVTLTQEQVTQVNKDYTRSGPAYVCYAKGRELYVNYTETDNDKAIELFKEAINKDPNYALACAGLADAYAQKGGYYNACDRDYIEEAIKMGEKSRELDPDLPEAYKALGIAYTYKGRPDMNEILLKQGEDNLKKALTYNDHYLEAHLNLGKIYLWLGKEKYSDAQDKFEFVIEKDKFNPVSHYYMGYFYGICKNYDDALKEYETAIKLEKDLNHREGKISLDSYINIACCYIEDNELDKAKEALKEAEKINPDYSYCHYSRSLLYAKEEKYEEALEEMNIYLTMDKKAMNEPINKERKEHIDEFMKKIKEELENEKKGE